MPRVSGESLSAKTTCAGAATTSCTLTYSLALRETLTNGKPVGVAASKKIKRTTKTVTIGSAKLGLAGGTARTVELTLNRWARSCWPGSASSRPTSPSPKPRRPDPRR